MTNAYSTYRQPLYLLTDDAYNAVGSIAITREGRYVGRATDGRSLFDRKDGRGAIQAAERIGAVVVSSAWYGVRA